LNCVKEILFKRGNYFAMLKFRIGMSKTVSQEEVPCVIVVFGHVTSNSFAVGTAT